MGIPVWEVELSLGGRTISVLTTDRQVDAGLYGEYTEIEPVGYIANEDEEE